MSPNSTKSAIDGMVLVVVPSEWVMVISTVVRIAVVLVRRGGG